MHSHAALKYVPTSKMVQIAAAMYACTKQSQRGAIAARSSILEVSFIFGAGRVKLIANLLHSLFLLRVVAVGFNVTPNHFTADSQIFGIILVR